ncbi:MAG: phage holin family protein [Schwartzia sp.]|nr:phage holin family protein [Schwartzia sp. (in: firmicutes)]
MFMEWESFWPTLRRFFSDFWEKAAASAALAMALRQHASLLACFSLLVVLDCLTRWIALAYAYCRERGQAVSLMGAVLAIPAARRAGRIDSRTMKERGLSKLLLYAVCVLVACLADGMMAAIGAPGWLLRLIVSYMAVTETLSIVENLSDAGVKSLAELAAKLKGRG